MFTVITYGVAFYVGVVLVTLVLGIAALVVWLFYGLGLL